MGATGEELEGLHQFAEKYRKEQSTRETINSKELEQMRNELKLAAVPFGILWKQMGDGENISVPTNDGQNLVIHKIGDTIRMAITSQEHQPLDGYIPDLDPIRRYQSIKFDWWMGRDPQPVLIDHMDGDQIRQFTQSEASYMEAADHVRTGAFRDEPPDTVIDSFHKLGRIIKLPGEIIGE